MFRWKPCSVSRGIERGRTPNGSGRRWGIRSGRASGKEADASCGPDDFIILLAKRGPELHDPAIRAAVRWPALQHGQFAAERVAGLDRLQEDERQSDVGRKRVS